MASLSSAMLALAASPILAFDAGPLNDTHGRADVRPIVIVAEGTAYFIKDGEFVRPGMTPFEDLRWLREPSATALSATIPDRPKTWLYSDFECQGITRSGHLQGCRVDPARAASIRATSQRTLRLLRRYAVSREDALRLRQRTTGVHVSFQIQFAGVTDEGLRVSRLLFDNAAATSPAALSGYFKRQLTTIDGQAGSPQHMPVKRDVTLAGWPDHMRPVFRAFGVAIADSHLGPNALDRVDLSEAIPGHDVKVQHRTGADAGPGGNHYLIEVSAPRIAGAWAFRSGELETLAKAALHGG